MDILIKSLQRLYINNQIDINYINELKTNSKISEEEYNSIIETKENTDISPEEFMEMVEAIL